MEAALENRQAVTEAVHGTARLEQLRELPDLAPVHIFKVMKCVALVENAARTGVESAPTL